MKVVAGTQSRPKHGKLTVGVHYLIGLLMCAALAWAQMWSEQ